MALTAEQRQAIVDELVANDCCWTEDDREVLANLSDDSLQREQKRVADEQNAIAVANAARSGFEDPFGNKHKFNADKSEWETVQAPTANKKTDDDDNGKKPEPKPVENKKDDPPMTEQEWFEKAPASVREGVQNANKIVQEKKDALIEQITANLEGDQKEAVTTNLKTKTLDELEILVALAPKKEAKVEPTANYSGSHTPQGPTDNKQEVTEDHLIPPVMEYESAK